MQSHIKRTLHFVIILTILCSGGSFIYEQNYAAQSTNAIGEIKSFKRKAVGSAQGDPIEMEIVISLSNSKIVFYSSRNVIEHVTGKYKVGDRIPVLYNAKAYPIAKIGNIAHIYKFTFIFLILGFIFIGALIFARRINQKTHNKANPADGKKRCR